MIELKFKKVDSDKYTLMQENKVIIKPFLTISELNTIILDMKENQKEIQADGTKIDTGKPKSALARHFSKVILFTDFCTNLDISEMKADEVYDLASELGLMDVFKTYIEMYNDIDEMIKSDESTYELIKEITDGLLPQLNIAMEKLGDGSGFFTKVKEALANVNK